MLLKVKQSETGTRDGTGVRKLLMEQSLAALIEENETTAKKQEE